MLTAEGRALRLPLRVVGCLLLVLSAVVSSSGGLSTPFVSAQQVGATDAELDRASAGRTVSVGSPSAGGRVTVVPLEVYVARVVAGEGEPNAPEATQQALAIAIRTFALANARRHAREGFDLCDGTHCQVLRSATAATRDAALSTSGRVLMYNGAPAEVFYSASCGGQSESASDVWPGANLPYLRSVLDDVHADDVPWTLTITLKEIRDALARVGFTGSLTNVEIHARSESGRATRLGLTGLRPDTITGDAFRAAIGASVLRSTAFGIERGGETIHFTGRGYGHGVGMCVIGAGRRARRGESVEQILHAYYPGLQLAALGSVASGVRAPEPPRAGPPVAPSPAGEPAPPPGKPSAAGPAPRRLIVRAPAGALIGEQDLEAHAARALAELGAALGTTTAALTVQLHESTESFRSATGRPWWVSAAVTRGTIDLAPSAVLADRENLDMTIRIAVAELLMSPSLNGQPAWARVGGARYFAHGAEGGSRGAQNLSRNRSERSNAVRCPADAELTFAVSAAAQREAEARAEACFARVYRDVKDWRAVK
jgi:SpoIID/LytB domain protein